MGGSDGVPIASALVLSRLYLLVCRDVTCCDHVRASPIEAVYVIIIIIQRQGALCHSHDSMALCIRDMAEAAGVYAKIVNMDQFRAVDTESGTRPDLFAVDALGYLSLRFLFAAALASRNQNSTDSEPTLSASAPRAGSALSLS